MRMDSFISPGSLLLLREAVSTDQQRGPWEIWNHPRIFLRREVEEVAEVEEFERSVSLSLSLSLSLFLIVPGCRSRSVEVEAQDSRELKPLGAILERGTWQW